MQRPAPASRKPAGDKLKKALVLVVGIVLFGNITLWRSLVALEEGRRWVPSMLEPECDGLVELIEQTRLPGPRAKSNIHRYEPLPGLPHIRLGTLRVVLSNEHLDALEAGDPHEYGCLRSAKELLGANAWVFDRSEQGERFGPNAGRLVESVYLLHNEQVPPHLRVQLGSHACTISRVVEQSPADEAGIEVGDIVLAIGRLTAAPNDPCGVAQVMDEHAPETPVRWTVLRDQVPIQLEAHAPRRRRGFGAEYRKLPILAPQQWAPTPFRIRG